MGTLWKCACFPWFCARNRPTAVKCKRQELAIRRVPPSPLTGEAAVVTRWRLSFCAAVIFRSFGIVLKTC